MKEHKKDCPRAPYDPLALLETYSTSTECICEDKIKEEWVYDSGPLEVESKQDWNAALEGITEFKDENLTIHFQPDNKMLAQFTADRLFVLYGDEGQKLVTVHLENGDIEFGENYTPDEAARIFWKTIGMFNVSQAETAVDEAWSEYEKTLKESAELEVEWLDFTQPNREELAQGKGSKVEVLPGGEALGELEDLKYFQNRLAQASQYVESIPSLEKQIELLEDSIVIYKEHRPSELPTMIDNFDDAMKVID